MLWTLTLAMASDGTAEICDALDNDNDGRIDDGAFCEGCEQFNIGSASYLVCPEAFINRGLAETRCEQFGYHLVDLQTEEEHDAVAAQLDLLTTYWSGLTDAVPNQHTWSDGSAADFVPWAPLQPDDLDGSEGCAWLFAASGANQHELYDVACGSPGAGAVCEIDGPVDPCDTSEPPPEDTAPPVPPAGPPPAGHVLCGCSSGATPWGGVGVLGLLLLFRQRRALGAVSRRA